MQRELSVVEIGRRKERRQRRQEAAGGPSLSAYFWIRTLAVR
jgi:hypothetical protein